MRVLWMDPREVYYARVFRRHRESSSRIPLVPVSMSMVFAQSIPSNYQLGRRSLRHCVIRRGIRPSSRKRAEHHIASSPASIIHPVRSDEISGPRVLHLADAPTPKVETFTTGETAPSSSLPSQFTPTLHQFLRELTNPSTTGWGFLIQSTLSFADDRKEALSRRRTQPVSPSIDNTGTTGINGLGSSIENPTKHGGQTQGVQLRVYGGRSEEAGS